MPRPTEAEIQARKEASLEKYKQRAEERAALRAEQREVSQWFKDYGISLFYLEIDYECKDEWRDTIVSIAAKVLDEDGVPGDGRRVRMTYTIMSPKDTFSRPEARRILKERYETVADPRRHIFYTKIPMNEMRDTFMSIIKYDAATRPELTPRWLYGKRIV